MQYSFIVLGLGHWSLVRRPNNVVARTLEGSFYALSHWLRAMWWSAARNNKHIYKNGAERLGLEGGLGLHPYLYPTKWCFLLANENSLPPQRSGRPTS